MPPRKPADAGPAADTEAMITAVAMVLARLIVQSPGRSPYGGTFRQIAVQQLRVATDAEAELIEAWLIAHPGG